MLRDEYSDKILSVLFPAAAIATAPALLFPEFRGSLSGYFFESRAEVGSVKITYSKTDIRDTHLGIKQQILGMLYPYIGNKGGQRHILTFCKFSTKVGSIQRNMGGNGGQR